MSGLGALQPLTQKTPKPLSQRAQSSEFKALERLPSREEGTTCVNPHPARCTTQDYPEGPSAQYLGPWVLGGSNYRTDFGAGIGLLCTWTRTVFLMYSHALLTTPYLGAITVAGST